MGFRPGGKFPPAQSTNANHAYKLTCVESGNDDASTPAIDGIDKLDSSISSRLCFIAREIIAPFVSYHVFPSPFVRCQDSQ